MSVPTEPTRRELQIHGHRLSYLEAGEGEPLLLVHGIAMNAAAWGEVIGELAQHFHVIAPDLFGHGESDKPPGDYSIGAYASVLRDLILALDLGRVNVVGHSLGGGIAMQLDYQAPELISRMVLVDAGGLGRDIGRTLRAASLPGAPLFIQLATTGPMRKLGGRARRALSRRGVELPTDLSEGLDGFASLQHADAREAFLDTLRASTGISGQRASALDKLYLAQDVPVLIIWGSNDTLIPVTHAYSAKKAVPELELAIIPGAGHFPFVDDPAQFTELVEQFVASTTPSALDQARLGQILRERGTLGDPAGRHGPRHEDADPVP